MEKQIRDSRQFPAAFPMSEMMQQSFEIVESLKQREALMNQTLESY